MEVINQWLKIPVPSLIVPYFEGNVHRHFRHSSPAADLTARSSFRGRGCENERKCAHSATGCLACHADDFSRWIASQGYKNCTVRVYECSAHSLSKAITERGISFRGFDDDAASALISEVAGRASSHEKHVRFCLERFRDYLIENADARARHIPTADMSPRACLRREYESYLKHQRGLADSTIYHCLSFYDRFFRFRFGSGLGDPKDIEPDDITAFMVMLRDRGVRGSKSVPSHLRNLFKFLFSSGRTERDLSKAVLSARQEKPTSIPRYLPSNKVNRLLQAARLHKRTGRRNYAMVLMMARLGLRAPEVVAIQLNDIDWRPGKS